MPLYFLFRCGLLCRSTYELNAHISNVHLRRQRAGYKCRYCSDVVVNGESDIRAHLSEQHNINAEFTLHYVNTYLQGFTPRWMRTCRRMLDRCTNSFGQCGQRYLVMAEKVYI